MAKNNPTYVESEIKRRLASEIADAVYQKVMERSYVTCAVHDMLHLVYGIEVELNIAPPPKEEEEATNEDTSY